jgi:MFS family permease
MAASGACALLMGWLLHAPLLVLAVALVWGFAVVADSAQFSAVLTEVAPPHAVGTALTFQTALGFLLTSVTLTAVPPCGAWADGRLRSASWHWARWRGSRRCGG